MRRGRNDNANAENAADRGGIGGILLASILLICLGASPAFGSSWIPQDKGGEKKEATEYDTKADFLEQILKFVEWPKDILTKDDKEVVIGIFGKDPFGDALNALKKKAIRNRAVVVKYIEKLEDVKEKECHVLFVAANCTKKVSEVAEALASKKILVIGETATAVDQGAAISLVIKEKKVAFEVNLKAAKKAGLAISSKFTKLAARVLKPKDD